MEIGGLIGCGVLWIEDVVKEYGWVRVFVCREDMM
jgi:hypothetical protein